jgi:hypothetical protein
MWLDVRKPYSAHLRYISLAEVPVVVLAHQVLRCCLHRCQVQPAVLNYEVLVLAVATVKPAAAAAAGVLKDTFRTSPTIWCPPL